MSEERTGNSGLTPAARQDAARQDAARSAFMTLGRLLRRNLLYHWRGNLAVFLGVAVGTAVLTGALLVGDSLRGSLRDLTLQQLGWVDQALVAGRFFREDLAGELGVDAASPAILLQGSAAAFPGARGKESKPPRRIGKVTILGVDERFWRDGPPPLDGGFWRSPKDAVVLSQALAEKLGGVGPGDKIALYVQKSSAIPRETLLGQRTLEELELTVAQVLPADSFGSRFNLRPNPLPPNNAFVPLGALRSLLGIKDRVVNALLVGASKEPLQEIFARHLTLEDWGLELRTPESRAERLIRSLDPRGKDGHLRKERWQGRVPDALARLANPEGMLARERIIDFYRREHGYLSLESRRMFLEPEAAAAAQEAAKETGLRTAPTLVYLADSIAHGGQEIPYAVVAALDPGLPSPLGPFLPPPLGPFLPFAFSSAIQSVGFGASQGTCVLTTLFPLVAKTRPLQEDEIDLADWKESPLRVAPHEPITLTYFKPDGQGRLQKQTRTFRLRGMIPISGAADDPDLTPEFPGITDKLDLKSWEKPPFPYDGQRNQPRDERYWKRYRTTPKAYIALAEGQRLWGSRFGDLTSIRLAAATNDGFVSPEQQKDFRRCLLAHLRPEQGGLIFQAVRAESLKASGGSTDFSGLFLGFSAFLIVSALLLVGLLFRLNIDRRASEIGLLLATGFRRGTVRRLLLREGGLLAAAGALAGAAGAVLYAWLLLEFLNDSWPGAWQRSFLRLHATPAGFLRGYGVSLAVSLLTITWAMHVLAKVSPSALLQGEISAPSSFVFRPSSFISRPSFYVFLGAAAGAIGCILATKLVSDQESQAVLFFGSGAFALTGALAVVWLWMVGTQHRRIGGSGWPALARLGCRNATRHPLRSLLTAGLLASASFLIVAIDSFRRQPDKDFLAKDSGSGGFSLLAESDLPIFEDLNSEEGRAKLSSAPEFHKLRGVKFYACRLRAGDDASCLNLYQPRRPRLLGVPHDLIERGGFQFQGTLPLSGDKRANPWHLLEHSSSNDVLPVFGEANSVKWILKSGLGKKELSVPDSRGRAVNLQISGLFHDSIFQSELVMSEADFLKLYPDHEGYNFFLIEAPPERMEAVKELLETALAGFGFEATSTRERLQAYLEVENTYLDTFKALGGLGLLLGSLGLAVVLLRSVWERRGELALFRALGFRKSALAWLVLAENGFLLILGLAAGTLAALVAVAPHLAENSVDGLRLLGFVALVLLVGLSAGAAAVAATLRAPLLLALRRD